MSEPVVLAVAITGSVPRKSDNPAVPISVTEQIESTHAAFEAGATLVHVHVRNDDETPSSDPARFAAFQAGVRRCCPGIIVQFSTGGRGRDQAARGSSLVHRPDMASLSTGSVNFPSIVYENPASLVSDLAAGMLRHSVRPEIEIFDLSHLHGMKRLIQERLVDERPHVQFVMGLKNAMPADPHLLDLLLGELRRILPRATWTAAGIGRYQAELLPLVGTELGFPPDWRLKMQRRIFGHEFKLEAVKLIKERDVAVAQAARDIDVAESVLRRWLREGVADPQQAFPGHGQLKPEQ